ncbi:hypothetical protein [Paradesulfitobacterium ferrireducens]|uniref:hypothetical protein n=1 Tax=Paradesulfitobacterium ferrireducens TaxID=2816476 RepID=UPI001A8C9990|nr:hypothetical protein [Paradesulfitobacterium ferrireducens]
MKTRGFLFILFSLLLLLNGCSTSSSQNPVVAQMAIETIHYELPYNFSIVQTKGSSTYINEKPSYSGIFDLVVQDGKGAETSRKSLNQYFGNIELTIVGPVNLTVNDYNADNLLDIAIGFAAGDGSEEYKYVIFSVGKDGKLFSLPVKGYKENGFVYTAAGSCSIAFTQTGGTGEGKSPSILIGVEKQGGGFEPAKYTWDGKQFKFQQENPFIISQAELIQNGQRCFIKVIQTEYKKPLTPDEPGFSIDGSMYRGRFDLLSQDSAGKVTSRIPLNTYFGNDDLGFGGSYPLVFEDYNTDGNYDFAIGRPVKNSPEFQYLLFSINPEGTVYNLPVVGYKEDGFVYSAGGEARFPLLKDGETGFEVTLSNMAGNGFTQGKYVWNGSEFIFTDSD